MMPAGADAQMREAFHRNAAMAKDAVPAQRVKYMRSADYYLDQWLDARDRATEWDATAWGLPTAAMRSNLVAMRARPGTDWPHEVI